MLEIALIVLPLAAAIPTWWLRNRPSIASLGALAVALVQIALIASQVTPLAVPQLDIFVSVNGLSATLLVIWYVGLAVQCLYAREVPQGPNFFLLAMAFDAAITAAILLSRQLAISGLLLAGILAVGVYAINPHSPRTHALDAAVRMLISAALTATAILISVLLIDAYSATHDPTIVRLVAGVLSVAVGLLVAVFPFHLWLPRMSELVPPMVAVWPTSFVPAAALTTLIFTAEAYPWLHANVQTGQVLRAAATVAALVAGYLAATSGQKLRTIVFASIASIAFALAGIASASPLGMTGAFYVMLGHTLALLALFMSLAHARNGEVEGRNARWTRWGLFVGGLALAGVPPLGTFAGRWLILRALGTDPAIVVGLLMSSALVLVAFVRLLRPTPAPDSSARSAWPSPTTVSLSVITLALLALGVYPSQALAIINDVIAKFPGLS